MPEIPLLSGSKNWVSLTLTASTFLVSDFARGAAIRDRQEARVEVSREHSDFFTRNLVAILCEERIALTESRPASFVKGSSTRNEYRAWAGLLISVAASPFLQRCNDA